VVNSVYAMSAWWRRKEIFHSFHTCCLARRGKLFGNRQQRAQRQRERETQDVAMQSERKVSFSRGALRSLSPSPSSSPSQAPPPTPFDCEASLERGKSFLLYRSLSPLPSPSLFPSLCSEGGRKSNSNLRPRFGARRRRIRKYPPNGGLFSRRRQP